MEKTKILDTVEVLCSKHFTLSRPIWDIDIDKTEIGEKVAFCKFDREDFFPWKDSDGT